MGAVSNEINARESFSEVIRDISLHLDLKREIEEPRHETVIKIPGCLVTVIRRSGVTDAKHHPQHHIWPVVTLLDKPHENAIQRTALVESLVAFFTVLTAFFQLGEETSKITI